MTAASMVRVLIATTGGPVEIEQVIKEPADNGVSVAVIGNSTDLAPFSGGYNAFVARSTGLIARLYGHDSFRLVISSSIDAGSSWQLGVLIAHGLYNAQRLADTNDGTGVVVLVTGRVGPIDLKVLDVGDLGEKLRLSLDRLRAESEAGRRIVVVWPKENEADADAAWREKLLGLGAEILEVGTVQPVFEALQLGIIASDGRTAELPQPPTWKDRPFRALESFTEEHRDIFFGRGRAREEVLDRLRRAAARGCAFLLIHGSSGAGKSSLARAGLLGDLRQLAKEADEWRAGVLVPGRSGLSPITALAEAMIAAVPELGPDTKTLADLILAQPADALLKLEHALAKDGRRAKLVLIVDQLEELFLWTREQSSAQAMEVQRSFAKMLARLSGSGNVWVIATLRSDLLSLLDDSTELSRLASDRSYRLERPGRWALREIVEQPAKLANLRFEDEDAVRATGMPLVELLVDAAAKSPGSLPLLEFALSRLYDQRSSDGAIDYAAYERMGGLEGAISLWADDVVRALNNDDAVRAIGREFETTAKGVDDVVIDATRALLCEVRTSGAVNDVILALARVEPRSDAGPRRNIVARTAKLDALSTPMHEAVIEALRKARLIVPETVQGQRTIRVAHEALLSHWDRAQRLVNQHADALELRDRLEGDALAWSDQPHDDLLIAGRRLEVAEELVKRKLVPVSQLVCDYVKSSTALAERLEKADRDRLAEDARRQVKEAKRQRTIAVLILMVFVAFWVGTYIVEIRREADQNAARHYRREIEAARDRMAFDTSKLIASGKESLAKRDPLMATLLALYAFPYEFEQKVKVVDYCESYDHPECRDAKSAVAPFAPAIELLRTAALQAAIAVTRSDVHDFFDHMYEEHDKGMPLGLVYIHSETLALVHAAQVAMPRCLSGAELTEFHLDHFEYDMIVPTIFLKDKQVGETVSVPSWCIEMRKSPYDTVEWRQWLADWRAGKIVDWPLKPKKSCRFRLAFFECKAQRREIE